MAEVKSKAPAAGASRPRRAYHTKTKTGCLTCRIRKVRCDEDKPACTRCVSTGRKCDGYTLPPSSTPSSLSSSSSASLSTPRRAFPDAAADLKLLLPRQNPDEVRSYRYFLDVTAPSLAGAFYAEFWLSEVPRVCLSDAAIWHAVVSLGSVHEYFGEHGRGSRNVFALRQFNSSIRCLTESRSPRHADRWRALIVSTIFTCVCTIQGLHDQTQIHLQAGCNLLRELQNDGTKSSKSSQQDKLQKTCQSESRMSSTPISIAPIHSILMNLELQANALDHGGITDSPTLLSQNQIFNVWRFYTAPSSTPFLTLENVVQANRAAESLLNGLVLFSQQHVKELGDLQTGKSGLSGLTMLAARQEAHTRSFVEIGKAVEIFQEEIETTPDSPRHATPMEPHTILPLRLFHTANRLLLIQDPEEPDLFKRHQRLPALCTSIVDLAEQIMNLDPAKTSGMSYTQQLFFVAHSGFSQSVRRRAVALLRRPRLEGVWDSLISASLAEAIMDREREATREYRVEQGLDTETVGSEEEDTNPLFRIFNITFAFTGRKEASVMLRTWREKLDDVPGQRRVIRW